MADRFARASSMSTRSVASGVRSSCEALATNRRWLAKARSSRPSMASKVSASCFSSSLGPGRLIRACKVRSDRLRAASVMRWTGARARPAIHHDRPNDTMVMMPEGDGRRDLEAVQGV